jgi:hypothetical protein
MELFQSEKYFAFLIILIENYSSTSEFH